MATISELKKAIDRLSVPTKPKQPVLANVHLKADGSRLRLTTTDLTQFTSTSIACDCEPFEITAPFEILKKWLKAAATLPQWTSIELATIPLRDDSKIQCLQLKSGSIDYRFAGIAAEQYPAVPSIASGNLYHFDRSELKASLKASLKVAHKEDWKEPLTGVGFRVKDGKLTIAATDGQRYRVETQDVLGENISVVIPKAAIDALAKCTGDTVSLRIVEPTKTADGAIAIELDETTIASRTLQGQFPWETLDELASPLEQPFAVDRRMLKAAVDRQSREKGEPSVLTASSENQQIVVSGSIGEEFVFAQVMQSRSARLNPVYLAECLAALTSTEVLIELGEVTRIAPLGGKAIEYGIGGIQNRSTGSKTASTGDSEEVATSLPESVESASREAVEAGASPPSGDPATLPPLDHRIVPFTRRPLFTHPELGTLEPNCTEATDRLLAQLKGTVQTPMSGYVISTDEMKQAVCVSLRPDQAFEVACGITKMVPISQDVSEFVGRYCLIHATQVSGDLEDEVAIGLQELDIKASDAPANHVLGYGKIAQVKKYDGASWDADYQAGLHRYPVSLVEISQAAGEGEVWGVIIEQPALLCEAIPLKSGLLHEFWTPNNPSHSAVFRQVFEADRPIVDIEREVDSEEVES